MPITPFHFGPGAVFHALSPRRVSFLAFCAANCITDCETIYNFALGRVPLHRFLHTYLGAAVVAAATSGLFFALRLWARRDRLPNDFDWQQLTWPAVALGAALGSFSHIVLDGIMHADVRPFAPWRDDNPYFRMITLGQLHLACLAAGMIGVGILLLRRFMRSTTL